MTGVELLEFSMREKPAQPGADWFRIVKAKGKTDPTKVYIYDEIGFWGTSAKDFAAVLNEIDTDEIHLHLNSPGGSVFDGLAIYAALKSHDAKVTAVVDGLAASAASFILQAADVRQMSRNGQVMIHDAKAYAGGSADQMRKAADLLDRMSDNIADIYAVRSGQGDIKSWRDTMRADPGNGGEWYNGNEAVDAGLADEVIDNPDETEEGSKNSWTVEEVEAFLAAPPDKLAQDTHRVRTTNRVEEALMTGANTQDKQTTPPPAAQPPAPAVPAAQAPEAPSPASGAQVFMVNGVEVTDFAAVQSHIAQLEAFRKETIDGGRKSFVAKLAEDGKILANDQTLSDTEEFALSLSPEQFLKWKASMDAAPANSLFQKHGANAGQSAPTNGGQDAKAQRIRDLEEIVQQHRFAGVNEDEIQKKPSYQELQQLKSETGA